MVDQSQGLLSKRKALLRETSLAILDDFGARLALLREHRNELPDGMRMWISAGEILGNAARITMSRLKEFRQEFSDVKGTGTAWLIAAGGRMIVGMLESADDITVTKMCKRIEDLAEKVKSLDADG